MPRFLSAAAAVGLFAAAAAAQPVVIEVFPSVGPNGLASPSFPGYGANAAAGVGAGGSPTGTPGTPAYYEAVSGGTVSILDMLMTNVPSWRGQTNPPPPFDQERGNQVFFGVRIADVTGGTIQLSNLAYELTNTLDPNLSGAGDFSLADYSPSWVGVVNGPDGEQLITSGPGTQEVIAIWGVGVGFGVPVPGDGLPDSAAGIPGFDVRATYILAVPNREELEFRGSGEVNVTPFESDTAPVPAPAGLVLGLIAIGSFFVARRRRG